MNGELAKANRSGEEANFWSIQHSYQHSPIQETVLHLARSLWQQGAGMAGGKIAVARALPDALDAHRVAGAPARSIECPGDCSIKLSWFAHPDEATHRAFGVACGGVDQHPGHLWMSLGEVDPFTK